MENKLEIYRPFSPPIGKYKLPKNTVENLNNYVDDVIKSEKLENKLDMGNKLAGEVSQEFLVSNEFLSKGLLDFLALVVGNYIKLSNGEKIENFSLIEAWVVRQFKNEYNPIHWHGGHISGVAYLKIPETFGENFQKNKKENRNGQISFIHGSRQFLSSAIISFKPVVGEMYIFPHYLMHSVYPFYSEGERRSFSFNANIDNKVYNAYKG